MINPSTPVNIYFLPSLPGPTTLSHFPLPSVFPSQALLKRQLFTFLNLNLSPVQGIGPRTQRIMAISGLQVQPPPCFTRTFSSGKYQPPSHILVNLFAVPPPSRIEIPQGGGGQGLSLPRPGLNSWHRVGSID